MLELQRSALNIYPLHPSRSDALSAFRVIFFFLDTPLCQPRHLIGIYWVQSAVLCSTGYLSLALIDYVLSKVWLTVVSASTW